MAEPNPTRKLTAEVVGQLVSTRLPHHAPNLVQDRAWLWLVCGHASAGLLRLGIVFHLASLRRSACEVSVRRCGCGIAPK